MNRKLPLLIASASLLASCGNSITVSSQAGSSAAGTSSADTSSTSSLAPEAISSAEEEVSSIVNDVIYGDLTSYAFTMETGALDVNFKNVRRGATREEDTLVDNRFYMTVEDLDMSGKMCGPYDELTDPTFLAHASGTISESHVFDFQGKEENTYIDPDTSEEVTEVTYTPSIIQDELKSQAFVGDIGLSEGYLYGDLSDDGVDTIATYLIDTIWGATGLEDSYKEIISSTLSGMLRYPFKADLQQIVDKYEAEFNEAVDSAEAGIVSEVEGLILDITMDEIVDYVLDYLNDEVGVDLGKEGEYIYDLDFDKADVSAFISDVLEALPFEDITDDFIAQICSNLVIPSFEGIFKITNGNIQFDYDIDFTGRAPGLYNPLLEGFEDNLGEISLTVKAKGSLLIKTEEGEKPNVPLDGDKVKDKTDAIISIIETVRDAIDAADGEAPANA